MKPIRLKLKPQPLAHTDARKIIVRYKDGQDFNPVDPSDPQGKWHHTDRFRSYDLDRQKYANRLTKEFGEGKLVEHKCAFYWARPAHRRLSLKQLAALARKCKTKKEMAFTVRGDQLDECVRIKAIQSKRHTASENHYEDVKKRRDYRKQLKPSARRHAKEWRMAFWYQSGFKDGIAKQIKSGWQYEWNGIDYCLHLDHSRTVKEIKHSRGASSYTMFTTNLTFDLLQEEAIWIGGLLTIRRKEHASAMDYPCWWLVRRNDGPGLVFKQGWMLNGDYHITAKTAEQARRKFEKLDEIDKSDHNRDVAEKYIPPKGWVNRHRSLMVGNCKAGTDSWIQNKLIPYLKSTGATIGNITGLAVRASIVLKIERSIFTLRCAD